MYISVDHKNLYPESEHFAGVSTAYLAQVYNIKAVTLSVFDVYSGPRIYIVILLSMFSTRPLKWWVTRCSMQ